MQSGKVSGKFPMLLFHCPEQHIYIHTDAGFISNILQLFLKLHESYAPNYTDMAACIFHKSRMVVKLRESSRWKLEKSRRVTSSYMRKHLLDLIASCSGLRCSFQGAADCSQLLYNTVMKHAVPLPLRGPGLLLWKQTFSAHPSQQVVVHLSTLSVCVCVGVCNVSIGRSQERNTPCGMTSLLRADAAVSRKWPWEICSSISRYGLLIPLSKETHFLHTLCYWVHILCVCVFLSVNLLTFLQCTQWPLFEMIGHFTPSIHNFRTLFSHPGGRSSCQTFFQWLCVHTHLTNNA